MCYVKYESLDLFQNFEFEIALLLTFQIMLNYGTKVVTIEQKSPVK